jgi:hypothetical protein
MDSAKAAKPASAATVNRPQKVARGERDGYLTEQTDPGARPCRVANGGIEQAGREVRLSTEPAALAAVFGIGAARLLGQLLNVVQPDPDRPIDAATINLVIAMVRGIGPSNAIEAMMATMLVAAQYAALDASRRGMHPDQSPAGRQSYLGLSLKAMRTFAQLVETLNHGRGKGPVQRVVVERVMDGTVTKRSVPSVQGIDHENSP